MPKGISMCSKDNRYVNMACDMPITSGKHIREMYTPLNPTFI